MVSAAKLRRAQDAIAAMRPYASKLRDIMENISGTLEGGVGGELTKARPVEKVLIVAVNSNQRIVRSIQCGCYSYSEPIDTWKYSRQAKKEM